MGIEFKKITIMPILKHGEIEKAVRGFVKDSHTEETHADPDGLYNQTLKCIAQVLMFKADGRQFWLAEHDGEVLAYALCHISEDVDNQLCYWITQAWASPTIRSHKIIKIWFQQFREEAKKLMCKHIIIPSSRGVKAYCRWLGKGWHPYVTLLKEDI